MTARTPEAGLPEVVTYDGLPGSAGGAHSLRVKRPDVAFQRLQTFLESCTEPVSLPSWMFEIYQSGPSEPTAQLSSFATELFGGPRYKAQTHTEWNVPPGSVNEALDALVGCDAVTTHGRSVAALTCSAPVRLIDPNARAPYPDITRHVRPFCRGWIRPDSRRVRHTRNPRQRRILTVPVAQPACRRTVVVRCSSPTRPSPVPAVREALASLAAEPERRLLSFQQDSVAGSRPRLNHAASIPRCAPPIPRMARCQNASSSSSMISLSREPRISLVDARTGRMFLAKYDAMTTLPR